MDSIYQTLFGAFPQLSKEHVQIIPDFLGQNDGIFIDGELSGFTIDNILGGISVVDETMLPVLSTTPDGFGGEMLSQGGDIVGNIGFDGLGNASFSGLEVLPSVSAMPDGLGNSMFLIDGDIVGSSVIDQSGVETFSPLDIDNGFGGDWSFFNDTLENAPLFDTSSLINIEALGDIADLGDTMDVLDLMESIEFLDLF